MSTLRLGFAAAVSALLAGCAFMPPEPMSPELQTAYDTPLYCNGPEECKLIWERASYFVATESRWQVIALTDNLIETEGVPRGYYPLAYSIAREPMGKGRYRIMTQSWCGVGPNGCRPRADIGVARAKHYMRTGEK